MLLREIDTEFERHKILHYGVTGNKVVRHYFEMQHVFGPLYKGRNEDETEYTNSQEVRCDLYVVFPETNTGMILQKGIRLYCKPKADGDELPQYQIEYNDYLDSVNNTDKLRAYLVEQGYDSFSNYTDNLRKLMQAGRWVGLLEIEFVRQVDVEFAEELASYRLAYREKREQENTERKRRQEEREASEGAEQNAKTATTIREAIEILRNGGELKNQPVTVWKGGSDYREYSLINCLMRKYGINVPLRTQGWIASSLSCVTITDGHCSNYTYLRKKKTEKGSQAVFKYLNGLIDAVRRESNDNS